MATAPLAVKSLVAERGAQRHRDQEAAEHLHRKRPKSEMGL
jgi:hypothetical protein